jgi:hypothetical protein
VRPARFPCRNQPTGDQEDDMNQLASTRLMAVIGAGAIGRVRASPAISAISVFPASGGRGPIDKPEVAA